MLIVTLMAQASNYQLVLLLRLSASWGWFHLTEDYCVLGDHEAATDSALNEPENIKRIMCIHKIKKLVQHGLKQFQITSERKEVWRATQKKINRETVIPRFDTATKFSILPLYHALRGGGLLQWCLNVLIDHFGQTLVMKEADDCTEADIVHFLRQCNFFFFLLSKTEILPSIVGKIKAK